MSTKKRYCTNCGAELSPTVRFCPACGAQQELTSAPPAQQYPAPPPPPPQQQPYYQPVPQPTQMIASGKKNGNAFAIASIIFGIIALLIAGLICGPIAIILGAMAYNKKQKIGGAIGIILGLIALIAAIYLLLTLNSIGI
jgi:hypothetical protein